MCQSFNFCVCTKKKTLFINSTGFNATTPINSYPRASVSNPTKFPNKEPLINRSGSTLAPPKEKDLIKSMCKNNSIEIPDEYIARSVLFYASHQNNVEYIDDKIFMTPIYALQHRKLVEKIQLLREKASEYKLLIDSVLTNKNANIVIDAEGYLLSQNITQAYTNNFIVLPLINGNIMDEPIYL